MKKTLFVVRRTLIKIITMVNIISGAKRVDDVSVLVVLLGGDGNFVSFNCSLSLSLALSSRCVRFCCCLGLNSNPYDTISNPAITVPAFPSRGWCRTSLFVPLMRWKRSETTCFTRARDFFIFLQKKEEVLRGFSASLAGAVRDGEDALVDPRFAAVTMYFVAGRHAAAISSSKRHQTFGLVFRVPEKKDAQYYKP